MYKVNMPSKDSFSDSRYGQSYEHDHEDHYDHDTGYNSYLNTGIGFDNLSTGGLLSLLKQLPADDETAKKLIAQHKSLEVNDFQKKTAAYREWSEPTKQYLLKNGKIRPNSKPLHKIIEELASTYPALNEFLRENTYETYANKRKWVTSARKFCEQQKIPLPPKPEKKVKPPKSTADLTHFHVHQHKDKNGYPYLTIKTKPNHPHHHHPKPQ